MNGKLIAAVLCILLVLAALPARAVSYTKQAEGILSSADWDKVSPESVSVSAEAVDDAAAEGGRALRVVDSGSAADDWLAYRTVSGGPLSASATAVIRIRTGDPSSFSNDTLWSRNVVLSFATDGVVAKRAVGLAIRPNGAIVCNTISTQFYPDATPIPGDNTGYVTWTIVSRGYGYRFDVYRDGVKVIDNAENKSGGEGTINPVPGYCSLAVGAATNATPVTSTGSWYIDYAAYRSGEHPTWNPLDSARNLVGNVTEVGTGQPAVGVLLSLNNGMGARAATDANGDFEVADVASGSYKISANSSNHYAIAIPVVVPETGTAVCNFQIVRMPDPTEVITDDFNRADGTSLGAATTTLNPPGSYVWATDATEAVAPTISGGRLSLAQGSASYGSATIIPPSTAGFDMTMDVQAPGAGGWWGIGFGPDTSTGYHLWWPMWSGTFSNSLVYQSSNGLDTVPGLPVAVNWQSPRKFHLRVMESHHEVWIDDIKVCDVFHSLGGNPGIRLGFTHSTVGLIIDNLRIKAITPPYGTVSGKVTDAANPAVALSDATVRSSTGQSTTTDAGGNYSLTCPAYALITMTAVKDGYYTTSVPGVQPVPNSVATVNLSMTSLPAPTQADIVWDDFERTEIGATEDPNHFPWIVPSHEPSATVVGGRLELGTMSGTAGVSVGGGYLPADFDLSVNVQKVDAGGWSGITYRQQNPGSYDSSGGGTAQTDPGYLVWMDDGSISLWRGGYVQTATLPWTGWSEMHTVRIRAIGSRHEIWAGPVGSTLTKVIDVYDSGKLARGYIGLQRYSALTAFDHLTIANYMSETGQISGTVSDAANSTIRLSGAKVTLNTGQSATTDINGNFSFGRLPNGTYTVTTLAEDYYVKVLSTAISDAQKSVAKDVRLSSIPGPTTLVTDTFTRVGSVPLGTTEDALHLPWDRAGEAVEPPSAVIDQEMLMLWSVLAHGVSLDQAFQPADVDIRVSLTIWADSATENWGGVAYRQDLPGTYDGQNGQDSARAGYVVWCTGDGRTVSLWRNGWITKVTMPESQPIDWQSWPPQRVLRVRATGPRHEVWVSDNQGSMTKVVDAVDYGKLGGGYVGVIRDRAIVLADNLSVGAIAVSISGTAYDQDNPSTKLAGVAVYASNGQTTTTDSSGRYSISCSGYDNITLKFMLSGYSNLVISDIEPTPGVPMVRDAAMAKLGPGRYVFDTFSRANSSQLGTSEDGGHIPWLLTDGETQASIDNGALRLAGGSSYMGAYLDVACSDFDLTTEMTIGGSHWGSILYRWVPGVGTYNLWFPLWDTSLAVWSLPNGGQTLLSLGQWTNWSIPHILHIRVTNTRHECWFDGLKILDAIDAQHNVPGKIVAFREMADVRFDNLCLAVDGLLPVIAVSSTGEAKQLPNGTRVQLSGVVTGAFSGFFYVEDPDRFSGIKVMGTQQVTVGNAVTVTGTMGAANGEKHIAVEEVTNLGLGREIKPLALVNKSAGGPNGLSIGLLSTIWGRVNYVNDDRTYCVIDDGSGMTDDANHVGVRVNVAGEKKPLQGEYVTCTGVVRKNSAGVIVLQMRSDDDLQTVVEW